jgi:hypothetical protein
MLWDRMNQIDQSVLAEFHSLLREVKSAINHEISHGIRSLPTDRDHYLHFRTIASNWKNSSPPPAISPHAVPQSPTVSSGPVKSTPRPESPLQSKLQPAKIEIEKIVQPIPSPPLEAPREPGRPERKHASDSFQTFSSLTHLPFLQSLFPDIAWSEEIPSDEKAREVSEGWKSEKKILVPIAFIDGGHIPPFFEKVRAGVADKISPAIWASPEMALAADSGFQLFVVDRQFLNHHPALFKGRQIIVFDSSLNYESDLSLKQQLWQQFVLWKRGNS